MVSDNAGEVVDQFVSSFYGAFDNRYGQCPNPDRVASFFMPNAKITRIDCRTGELDFMDVPRFIAPRIVLLTEGALVDFHEWETAAETRVSGHLASRWSDYEKQGLLNGQPYTGQGRKHFQLVIYNQKWRIISLAWEDIRAQEGQCEGCRARPKSGATSIWTKDTARER